MIGLRNGVGVAALLAALALCGTAGEPAVTEANLILNPGFEEGAAKWRLVSDKGVKGGRVVEQADGNHALCAEGETYWVGSTDYMYFRALPAAAFAGKTVEISFRVKGDEDAYPGIVLVYVQNDRNVYKTVLWKPKYVGQEEIRLTDTFQRCGRLLQLPTDATCIGGVSVYNCTRRGRIAFDDFVMAVKAPPKEGDKPVARPAHPSAWDALAFTDQELIELSNTHNHLVVEWAMLYGALTKLERAAYYSGEFQPLPDERRSEIASLRHQTFALKKSLVQLQRFYLAVFGKRFGNVFTVKQSWRFYMHNGESGKRLLLSVGWRKSGKAPFVELERSFADAKRQAAHLLEVCQAHAKATVPGHKPVRMVRRTSGGQLFDGKRRPKHFLFGLRASHYDVHAVKWIGNDLSFHPVVRPTHDESGRMQTELPPHTLQVMEEWGQYLNPPLIVSIFLDPNTMHYYLSPSFRERLRTEPALRAHTELGPVEFGERYVNVNIFNQDVRAYANDLRESFWRLCGEWDQVAVLEYAGEPTFYAPNIMGKSYIFDYSDEAKREFRTGLAAKFESIAALNAAWGAGYGAFADIEPPTYDRLKEMKREDVPLVYEFQRFRKRALLEYYKTTYKAARRGCDKPVLFRWGREYFNGNSLDAFDVYGVASEAVDILCHHNCDDGTYRHFAAQNYFYSVCRYLENKPRGTLEFYVAWPEIGHFDWENGDPILLFHRSLNSLWRACLWDEKLISVWSRSTHPDKGYYGPDYLSGQTLAAEHLGAVPLVRKDMRDGIEEVLFKTRVATPKLGLLAPFDGTMVCQPDGQMAREGKYIHKFLADRNYDYFCVPEELIVDGTESLREFTVLLTPYVLWASAAVQSNLLKWVAKGGTLVCIGPFGFWDEYGRESRLLVDACFGPAPIEMRTEGLYKAALPSAALAEDPRVTIETVLPYTDGKQANLVSAVHGKGKIYLTADASIRDLFSGTRKVLLEAIDDGIGVRTAWSQAHRFELVTREDRSRRRYLFVINPSIRDEAEDVVFAAGEYERPVDLCVPGGAPLKARRIGGVTAFKVKLGPGEVTCLKLGKHRRARIDRERIDELTGAHQARQREAVQARLSAIAQGGDPVSLAKAMVYRNYATALLQQNEHELALQAATKAAEVSTAKAALVGADFFASVHTATPPVIDGEAPEWDSVRAVSFGDTTLKSMWDRDFLYLLVDVRDALVKNDYVQAQLWRGDAVEIFMDVLNQGGSRAPGPLDFHFTFGPNGAHQVEGGKAMTDTRGAGATTAHGYRIEIAIAHRDTFLHAAPDYALGFNVRRLNYGMKEGEFKFLADDLLVRTKHHPGHNVEGWPALKLCGGESKAAVEYRRDSNRIVVSGRGATLAAVCRQVGDDAAISRKANTFALAADLHLAPGGELVLGDERLVGADGTRPCVLSADPGSVVSLEGTPSLVGVDALAGLRACRIMGGGDRNILLERKLVLRVKDKNGHPVADATVGVRITARKTGNAIYEGDSRLGKDGRAEIAVLLPLLHVEGGELKLAPDRCVVVVDDTFASAPYTAADVDLLRQGELSFVFTTHR